MGSFIKYPLVLGLVAAISGLALFATYVKTKGAIKDQEKAAKVAALQKVFLQGYGDTEETEINSVSLVKVWKKQGKQGEPDFYTVTGSGFGYNSSVPIKLLVGFSNPEKTNKAEIVGWSVISSEETPGLGEKIKAQAAAYTLLQKLTGKAKKPAKDRRTAFQKQFYNPEADKIFSANQLIIKKEGGQIDVITGATYTTKGVIKAIQAAAAKLKKALP